MFFINIAFKKAYILLCELVANCYHPVSGFNLDDLRIRLGDKDIGRLPKR